MQEYDNHMMINQHRKCKKLPNNTTLRKELHKAKMAFKRARDLTKYLSPIAIFANLSINHSRSGERTYV